MKEKPWTKYPLSDESVELSHTKQKIKIPLHVSHRSLNCVKVTLTADPLDVIL